MAIETHYQVYVTTKSKSSAPLRPVEKIALVAKHQCSILFNQGPSVYALIANGGGSTNEPTSTTSTIRIFKWRQSHFTMVIQQSTPRMQDVHLCETSDGTTVFVLVQIEEGSSRQATLLHVYIFGDDRWRHVQNMHVNVANVYTYRMNSQCFLMTTKGKCVFRQITGDNDENLYCLCVPLYCSQVVVHWQKNTFGVLTSL